MSSDPTIALFAAVGDKVTRHLLIGVASFAIFLVVIISLFGIYKAINCKKVYRPTIINMSINYYVH